MKNMRSLTAITMIGGILTANTAFGASSGQVNFTGELLAETCTVSNAVGEVVAVTLPTLGVGDVNATGTNGRVPFKLVLAGCAANTSLRAFFSGANVDVASGYLNNVAAAPAAGNVQIQLLNDDESEIDLRESTSVTQNSSKPVTTDAAGAATLNYFAQYRSAASNATAGAVVSQANYLIVYR